jgi:hypothetical protein
VKKYADSVSYLGPPVAGASVQVNVHGGGAATIYSDNGITQAANPLTTDANGAYSFYALDGRYDLIVSGAAIPTLEIADILLVDILPADLPTTPPATFAPTLWNDGGVISIGGSALLDENRNIFILDESKLG